MTPGKKNSVELSEVDEPDPKLGSVLVRTLVVGVCGTDREIVEGLYGKAPASRQKLVLGHESVGRVEACPEGCGFAPGDLVVGIVRHPDPEPCVNCAAGEWDMCRNGLYTEHGIAGLDGFCSELYRAEPQFLVKIDPSLGELGVLVEPASVVAKAWEHIARIGTRALWRPKTALITGAGPVGLLAALLSQQRGLKTHVFDRNAGDRREELVRRLGAEFHTGDLKDVTARLRADVIVECTGNGDVVLETIASLPPDGIECLAGLSSKRSLIKIDAPALNRELVLENCAVFGTVNANRRHYEAAAAALSKADPDWLRGLLTRQVPLESWRDALTKHRGDIKNTIDFRPRVPGNGSHGPAH